MSALAVDHAQPRCVYVAARAGFEHDVHGAALSRGAVGAIVHDAYSVGAIAVKSASKRVMPFILGVRDPLFAYQQLATHHRSRFDIPVVAVTGSNGKTTTKEMVASVMAHRWKILKTEGNLNNRIGVPQTLFRLNARHEGAVIEMGVDQVGQTTRLCEMSRPTIGVITNIGPDHLEFFGSMEGSAQSKAELLDLLPAEGTAVLNADDPYYDYLAARARCRVMSFGPLQGLLPDRVPQTQLGVASSLKTLMDMLSLVVASLLAGRLLNSVSRDPTAIMLVVIGLLAVSAAVTIFGVSEEPALTYERTDWKSRLGNLESIFIRTLPTGG